MAPAPRLAPRGRRYRYTLRTLLALFTLTAIWLGVATQRAIDQRRAVAVVTKFGGIIHYHHQTVVKKFPDGEPYFDYDLTLQPWAPEWLRRWIGEDYFTSVAEVLISGEPPYHQDPRLPAISLMSEEDVSTLGGLVRLREVNLIDVPITDQNLKDFGRLTSLEFLAFNADHVSDAGVAHLGGLTGLKKLRFYGDGPNNITDVGMRSLRNLHRLTQLIIGGAHLTDSGLEHLVGLPALEQLSLSHSPFTSITDKRHRKLQRLVHSVPGYCEMDRSRNVCCTIWQVRQTSRSIS